MQTISIHVGKCAYYSSIILTKIESLFWLPGPTQWYQSSGHCCQALQHGYGHWGLGDIHSVPWLPNGRWTPSITLDLINRSPSHTARASLEWWVSCRWRVISVYHCGLCDWPGGCCVQFGCDILAATCRTSNINWECRTCFDSSCV